MNMNIKVRVKNPWFWVGVVSVAITAIGVDPQTFTSWAAVWEGIKAVLSNPVQLVTMCLAVLSVFIDPTTAGVTDSENALTYTAPKKKGE
ncbi:phage holin [Butyricicoccus sp. AM28-25]|nr:phage holin [Butyricicoccus sp. AM28-25]RHT78699.1 phage holin [Butyricicoccus sp. AM28-25]